MIFGRQPALVIEAIKVALVMLATFGLPLSADMQVWIVGALTAAAGLWKAAETLPVEVTAITDFIQAAGLVVLGFTTAVSQAELAAVVAFAGAAGVLLQRNQVTPKRAPKPLYPGHDPVAAVRQTRHAT